MRPASLEFLGMYPRDKPEDDSARGASWGSLTSSVSAILRGVLISRDAQAGAA